MKQRITKSVLSKLAENCNLACAQNGWKFEIEYAYGHPRLVLVDSRGCNRDVSPRLPSGQLAEWIWAFLKGVEFSSNK